MVISSATDGRGTFPENLSTLAGPVYKKYMNRINYAVTVFTRAHTPNLCVPVVVGFDIQTWTRARPVPTNARR